VRQHDWHRATALSVEAQKVDGRIVDLDPVCRERVDGLLVRPPFVSVRPAFDKPAKLAKFRADEGLTFPLLSDADKSVMQAWGAYGEKTMYGRTSMGVIRSTFLVDAEGKIEDAQYGVKATGHVGRLLRDLKL